VNTPKTGPLTIDEFRQIWLAAVDDSYGRAFVEGGDGKGIEAFAQAWAQFQRVSQAIDTTTQAMFILPWSGQTNLPAGLAEEAVVQLTITRALLPTSPLVLSAGTFVGEVQTDWGDPEGVSVQTGRRYALTQDVVFEPGSTVPITVAAIAERVGYGYNNPAVGTISFISQAGSGFNNEGATVRGVNYPPALILRAPVQRVFLDAEDEADTFLPDHVGQYLVFTAGANVGKVARIVGWLPPDLSVMPPTGGTVELELSQSIRSFSGHHAGTFRTGETLTLKNGAAVSGYGLLHDATTVGADLFATFVKTSGRAVTSIVGDQSGATATIDVVLQDLDFTPETVAAWRILDWVSDWGVSVTNPALPAGGVSGMLEAIGRERNIALAPGEMQEAFRQRVAEIADVVSPNAIRRAIARSSGGVAYCFREAGQASYPGFFYDHDFYDYDMLTPVAGAQVGFFRDGEKVEQVQANGTISYAHALVGFPPANPPLPASPPGVYQLKGFNHVRGTFSVGIPIVGIHSGDRYTPAVPMTGGLRPEDRRRVLFDYLRMRAYFYVGLPGTDAGDSGFAYDTHPHGAYDGIGYLDFYDGYPIGEAIRNKIVQAAVDKVRAAGVGWELYQVFSGDSCP